MKKNSILLILLQILNCCFIFLFSFIDILNLEKKKGSRKKSQSTKVKMNELREQGNEAFKQTQFKKAANYYTQAIGLGIDSEEKLLADLDTIENTESLLKLKDCIKTNDCVHKCFNNRAQCYLKLGKYKAALDDCSRGILYFIIVECRPFY
jgi:tetratricopeptide (TPR) repeat protein